jgi:hypothetical protein
VKTQRALMVATAVVALSLAASGCTRTPGETTPPPTVTGARVDVPVLTAAPPTNLSEAPDDIVGTPGGSAYSANVHQQGVPDKWPEVQTVVATLTSGSGSILVRYRDGISTLAGQTRNNLLVMNRPGGHLDDGPHTIQLYTVGAPSALQFLQGSAGGLMGQLATLFVIEVPATLAPGRYLFGIGIEIDGTDYGMVACTVEVTG